MCESHKAEDVHEELRENATIDKTVEEVSPSTPDLVRKVLYKTSKNESKGK